MAHAIFKTGGKQYRAAEGDRVRVASLEGEPGNTITFGDVLAIDGDAPKFGKPTLAGAKVEAEIVRHGLDEKLVVYKFRRRKRSQTKNGHRQAFTEVKITRISA
ncbi:MAG TPA: 50S ribosomal protein L21 [Polyangiaceae bacterium]|jgi:large subunit ribosomal protein L21|nr:50S ribosomal protein L21 [Polyangiaceae bacterium]